MSPRAASGLVRTLLSSYCRTTLSRFYNGIVGRYLMLAGWRFVRGTALILLAAFWVDIGSSPTQAQDTDELVTLNNRVLELYRTGKYCEALPLAQSYAEAVKARRGSEAPHYAVAPHNLAAPYPRPGPHPDADP